MKIERLKLGIDLKILDVEKSGICYRNNMLTFERRPFLMRGASIEPADLGTSQLCNSVLNLRRRRQSPARRRIRRDDGVWRRRPLRR